MLKAELRHDALGVLGYKCDELVLTCKSGTQKYYFNPSLSADNKLYEKHKYGNWAEYMSRAKSLPLKTIIENEQFTMESVAVEIKPMVLEKTFFSLPVDSKVEKSPY